MHLPKNFLTWIMLLLLALLLGLAGWMFWALGKVEGAKAGGKRKDGAPQAVRLGI